MLYPTPSREGILNWIEKGDGTAENFNEVFDDLISKGTIYNINGKDSYHIEDIHATSCDQVEFKDQDTAIDGGNDLISMIKNVMLNERLTEKKNMEDLRNELNHKNSIIDKLLDNLNLKEKLLSRLMETIPVNKSESSEICIKCKSKDTHSGIK